MSIDIPFSGRKAEERFAVKFEDEGPRRFVSAGSLSLNPGANHPTEEGGQKPKVRLSGGDGGNAKGKDFQDAASAARAAAESAKNAVAAAQLAQITPCDTNARPNVSLHPVNPEYNVGNHGMYYRSQGLGAANNCSSNTDFLMDDVDDTAFNIRRHSCNVGCAHTDIKFDESECDEDTEMEQHMWQAPSNIKPGNASSVHPKLPDYDVLAARLEALKYHKS